EFLKLDKLFKIFLYGAMALSLFFLILINLPAVWVVIGVVSLMILIYGLSERYTSVVSVKAKFSSLSVAGIIISILFLIGGTSIQDYISNSLGIGNIESRPSWQSTIMVAKEGIQKNPIFGAGPNRFSSEWFLNKPIDVNATPFWDADFSFGVGFVPTSAITVGVLGFVAWLLFLLGIAYEGFKIVIGGKTDNFWRFLTLSSFSATLYLWILLVVYPPNIVIISLTFIFTGILLSSGMATDTIKEQVLDFSKNAKVSFLSVLSLVVLSVVVLSGGYIEAENVISHVNLERGLKLANIKGDIDGADRAIARAALLSKRDLYFRALGEVGILQMNRLIKRTDLSEDVLRSEFQNILTATIENSKKALDYDKTNYQNWLAMGRVYEAIVPLGISGAYEESLKMYNEALLRNPNNPSLYLFMARLEVGKGDNEKAKEYISKSLSIKNNYTEAIFLLSQIQVSEGRLREAIASVESASIISPNDPTVFFQLGLLRYNNKDYRGATSALERAVILNPIYSNAKYFLGLSYNKVDKDEEAIAQFEDLKYLNPDNEEVKLILSNLRAERSPFSDAVPPVDEKPEGRTKPPIDE
ncbi:MAG: tetratricopeptide repeat protein, partial [Patescibacteria group bacterium]